MRDDQSSDILHEHVWYQATKFNEQISKSMPGRAH